MVWLNLGCWGIQLKPSTCCEFRSLRLNRELTGSRGNSTQYLDTLCPVGLISVLCVSIVFNSDYPMKSMNQHRPPNSAEPQQWPVLMISLHILVMLGVHDKFPSLHHCWYQKTRVVKNLSFFSRLAVCTLRGFLFSIPFGNYNQAMESGPFIDSLFVY